MPIAQNMLMSLPLAEGEIADPVVASRMRLDGFTAFSPAQTTPTAAAVASALSSTAGLPAVRPVGVNSTYLADADDVGQGFVDFCADPAAELLLRSQLIDEVRACVCVCVCVCARARACVCVCVRAERSWVDDETFATMTPQCRVDLCLAGIVRSLFFPQSVTQRTGW